MEGETRYCSEDFHVPGPGRCFVTDADPTSTKRSSVTLRVLRNNSSGGSLKTALAVMTQNSKFPACSTHGRLGNNSLQTWGPNDLLSTGSGKRAGIPYVKPPQRIDRRDGGSGHREGPNPKTVQHGNKFHELRLVRLVVTADS